MESNTKKYGVFISYSHEDSKFVAPIVALLSAMRKDLVFYDTKELEPGKKWEPQLWRALEEAEVLIVFWSKYSAKSEFVRREYEKAIVQNKAVLPVLLDDSELDGGLSEYQWIDFKNTVNRAFNRRLESRRSILSAGGLSIISALAIGILSISIFFYESKNDKNAKDIRVVGKNLNTSEWIVFKGDTSSLVHHDSTYVSPDSLFVRKLFHGLHGVVEVTTMFDVDSSRILRSDTLLIDKLDLPKGKPKPVKWPLLLLLLFALVLSLLGLGVFLRRKAQKKYPDLVIGTAAEELSKRLDEKLPPR